MSFRTTLRLSAGTALAAALCALSPSLAADPLEAALDDFFASIEEAVPGKFSLNSRTRYERFATPAVDRRGFSQRFRYGYATPDFEGFGAYIEGETLFALNGSHRIHPLDQAGSGTELNQLRLHYADPALGRITLGRQIYTLDDQRFIGHVGWRQNIQTFDALTAAFTGVENLAVNAFYLDRVKRVDGSGQDLTGLGLNLRYTVAPSLAVTAFAYRLDFDRMAAWSNDTIGLRLTGRTAASDLTLAYALSYARQTDNSGSGPRDFSLDYWAGDLAATFHGVTLGAGFEFLEGDGTEGFRTPLATVHAFNGHADKFLPVAGFPLGLDDRYLYASYRLPVGAGIPLRVAHHWFRPEQGPGRYGRELNFTGSYAFNKYFSLVAKYGRYRPDSHAVGIGQGKKSMFTLELNFNY
ncbi:MAG: alginate export family protein [Opitutales bacterium]|nr:alginate export family protein [Opitutales bacterium]